MRLTPITTTSYLSASLTASFTTKGVKRGNGGAKEGKMRKSRPELTVSVKTGIVVLWDGRSRVQYSDKVLQYDESSRVKKKKGSGMNG